MDLLSYARDSDADVFKKTGFVFSFIKYIDFRDKKDEIELCIAGDKRIYTVVQKLSKLNTARSVLPKFYDSAKMEIKDCDIVYISESLAQISPKILAIVSGSGKFILTVSDVPNFVEEKEGLIEIYKDRNNVPKFGLNLKKFASERIEVSSKLVEAADKIY